jgi:sugar-phosphatase
MFKAAIFDMDGLLIDSEPLWKKSEKAVFGSLGLDLTLPMMRETTGFKNIDTVRHWHRKFPWNTTDHPIEMVERRIVERMIDLISTE